MYKIKQTVKSSITIFALGVIVLQSVFAALWIASNFGIMPEEHMASDYLKAAETFIVDDYMSILYALILRAIRLLAGAGKALFGVLLILQILAVFFSVWAFPWKIRTKVLAGLFLVTNPLILASEGSASVSAFTFAACLATAGFIASCMRELKKQYLVGFGISVLLTLLFSPDLLWFEAAILIPVAFVLFGIHGKKNFTGIIIWLAAAILSMVINMVVPAPGTYGRATKSAELFLLQYYPGEDMYFYDGVLKDYHGYESDWVITKLHAYDELLIYNLASYVETKLGAEDAKIIYRYLIGQYWERGKSNVIIKGLTEVGRYAFPLLAIPIIYENFSEGTHLAWVASNFSVCSPEISELYLYFGIVSSFLLSLFGITDGLLSANHEKRKLIVWSLFVVICLGFYCTFCNLKGFDYRLCPIACSAFSLIMLMECFEKN